MHIVCIYLRKLGFIVNSVSDNEFVTTYSGNFRMPMGISYISSSLKKAGYDPELVFYNVQKEKILTRIKETDKLVLLSIISEQDYEVGKIVISEIKKRYPKIKIGVGGVYPTLVPEDMMANKDVDMVCIGEGEIADVEYARQVEEGKYKKTDNLWIRDNDGQIIKCDRSVVIEDIDSLPYPDRDGWGYIFSKDFNKKQTIQCILLERGCNNRCIYCSHHALSKKQEGKYLRYRNIDKVIEEIEYVCSQYKNLEIIRFIADNALSNLKYFMELCQKLIIFNEKRDKKIRFWCSLNISQDVIKYTDKIIDLMKKANITLFNIGLQSGSLDIRKKLCRPYHTNEEFEKFYYMAIKAGIDVLIDLLWHPFLNKKHAYKETYKYLKKIQPLKVVNYWLTPFKGTELYEKYKDEIFSYDDAKLIDKIKFNILEYTMFYEVYGMKKILKKLYVFMYRIVQKRLNLLVAKLN